MPSTISPPGTPKSYDMEKVQIVGYTVIDLRFPTSLDGIGCDAMHKGTNGSHPYIQLHTNQPGLTGEGIVCFFFLSQEKYLIFV
jgi:hypothetical protein